MRQIPEAMRVQSEALTAQFYEWEVRGRGWCKEEYPVELEPPFAPFFGHFVPDDGIIDDGRKPSLWRRALGIRAEESAPPHLPGIPFSAPYVASGPLCVISVTIPRQGSMMRGEQMEQLLTMLSYRGSQMSIELIGTPEGVRYQVTCEDRDAPYVTTQLSIFLPGYGIRQAGDGVESLFNDGVSAYAVDFGLSEEYIRPIAWGKAGGDPYESLFGILGALTGAEGVIVQVLFAGVRNPWAEPMVKAAYDNSRRDSFFIDDPDMPRLAKEKVSSPLCAATVRAVALAATVGRAGELLSHVATAIVHASSCSSNRLMPLANATYALTERITDMLLRESHRVGMIVNVRELSTLAHFPYIPLRNVATMRATKAAPHSLLGHDHVIGLNEHNGVTREVSLSTDYRVRHTHILGGSGVGKSTLLHSMMMVDVRLGNGFLCLDPHGDLIDSLLETIPADRVRDVVLIDPSDSLHPIPFNILSAHSEREKELLASDLVALFRRFSTSWGDQMNSVFANAILAFLYNTEVGTLADLRRFLIEPAFRSRILSSVTDPEVSYYWQHEYPLLKGSSIGSILTRLDGFLRPKVIRGMVCQRESLDFASLMDGRKIVLVKLSQGLMGTENSYLLGALLISKVQQVAMARQAQARQSRVPFYCYIDEMHHFMTPSMSEILTGGRKYALGLVLAHQQLSQVQGYDADMASVLLTNTAVRICFRLGDTDAKRLQDGFASFSAADLQDLPVGTAVMRVNTASEDCTLRVVPFEGDHESAARDIVEHSRAVYSKQISDIASSERTLPSQNALAPTRNEQQPIKDNQSKPRAIEREHRYLQTFVKTLAEQSGYTAQLEHRTPDGRGQVDVLLERDGRRTAIEISVTTSAEWELHNIEKCISAGYDRVIVCASDKGKMRQIESLLNARLPAAQRPIVSVASPEQIQPLLIPSAQQSAENVVKGYRVKVQYDNSGPNRDELVRQIMRGR